MADEQNGGGSGPSSERAAGDGGGGVPDRDAARLVEANRRLRESAQRREDLIAIAAEELRAPSALMLRQLRRMERGRAALSDGERRGLEHLQRLARRISSIADGLVTIEALEAGRLQLRQRHTELADVVRRAAAALSELAQQRGIQLDVETPPYPLAIPIDAARVEEVVGVLMAHAVSGSPRGGRVRVLVEATQDGARVAVEGGTTAAARAGRRGSERLGAFAADGIDLAVCRAVAELHGGDLEVLDRPEGRLARISFPSGAPNAEAAIPGRAAHGNGRARLLVVDDDPDARDALAMLLSDDYEIALAADGHEALEAALASRPDLVLMDLYMPRMDGLAALEAMRADPLTADVPVIFISARGDELTRTRGLDLGAVDFLQKPFSGRELKARIERTLRFTRRETLLQQLARTDALTGLANVRAFRGRLEDEVKRARRYRTPLACVMVDMDNLKPINDELGHAAGDLAISAVADVIRRELRETDFGARYGGDEFVVLLPHTSAEDARVFAERVCVRMRDSELDLKGRRMHLSASFGVAALGDEALDNPGDTLVRRADAALYAAKRGGRGRVAAHVDHPARQAPPPPNP